MRKLDWYPTIRGFKAMLLNGKYVLEIWNDLQSGGWRSGVNTEMVKESNTGKSKIFTSLEEAKKAASILAEDMISERE